MLKGKVFQNKKLVNRYLTFLTVFALVITSLLGQYVPSYASTAGSKTPYTITLNSSSSSSSVKDDSHADKMADGAILQTFCWSFNTIKANMKAIADAGYTSLQTSPISKCLYGNNGNLTIGGNWYWHYQPIELTIGNYQLGTEDEFKAMCEEAHKYGVKVIVDIVVNHTTCDYYNISASMRNIPNYFRSNQSRLNTYASRYELTQNALLGMYEVNTQNKAVQTHILNYLHKCLECGADGFRYDTAKHIELPDDPGYGSDFWPTVLNNGCEFQYGEVLVGDGTSREDAYAKYMPITDSSYGYTIRTAISTNNFSTNSLVGWNINAPADKLVTWVESHDNYCDDNDSTSWLTDEQIKLAWAAICARSSTTPLFFDRPVGGGGSVQNRFPGLNKIGERGSLLFMDDEVAAVNKFRNAMEGQTEYLRNPNGDNKVLMIERGNKGVTIINLTYNNYNLSSATKLKDAKYTNQTDNNNVFTVSNGTISGTLPARSVVVLYDAPNKYSVSIPSCPTSFYTDSVALTLNSQNTAKATYSINGGTSYLYDNGDQITIGAGDAFGTKYTVELRGITSEGQTTSETYTIVKKDPNASTTIYFDKPSSWSSSINAYLYDESSSPVKKNAEWPGASMSYDSTTGYYKYSFCNDWSKPVIIFNAGTEQAPLTGEAGYDIYDNGIYNKDGFTGKYVVTKPSPTPTVTPSPSPSVSPSPSISPTVTPTVTPTITPVGDSISFTKPSSWNSTVYAYVYDESGSTVVKNANWPGKAMTLGTNGTYTYQLDSWVSSNTRVIFSDGNQQSPKSGQAGFIVTKGGNYDVSGIIISGGGGDNTITLYYATTWNTAYCHYQIGTGAWTSVPGVKMSASDKSGYKVITINLGTSTQLHACFNNGNNTWDSKNSSNYNFNNAGTYTVSNGNITSGSPQ